jgi:hypothetical protein
MAASDAQQRRGRAECVKQHAQHRRRDAGRMRELQPCAQHGRGQRLRRHEIAPECDGQRGAWRHDKIFIIRNTRRGRAHGRPASCRRHDVRH